MALLGTDAPLLYRVVRTEPNGKPIAEPEGAPQLMQILIQAGADPSKYEGAALVWATQCGWERCIELLRVRTAPCPLRFLPWCIFFPPLCLTCLRVHKLPSETLPRSPFDSPPHT